MSAPTRLLVAGYGSIGRRHAANLEALAPAAEIAVLTGRPAACEGRRVVASLDEAVGFAPQAAIVAGPAPEHVAQARALAEAGVHLLVEKPLSDRLDGTADLVAFCRRRGLVLMVGYCLRFDPGLMALKRLAAAGALGRVLCGRAEVGQYLPDWRPGRDYRETVSARADKGGGAVLELSHEIDYLRWLMGEIVKVSARTARARTLELDVEDCAELVLDFADGALGSIHLDMLQRVPARTCKLIGSEATAVWDGIAGELRLYGPGEGEGRLVASRPADCDIYRAELSHFLDCVEGRAAPAPDGEDGRRVLEIALAAKDSAASGRAVAV